MYTLKQFLGMLRESGKKLACFGTGLMAEEALAYKEIKEAMVCFIDNDRWKQGKQVEILGQRFPVYAPEHILGQADENLVILLTSGHYRAMEGQLREMGLSQCVEIYAYPVLKVSYSPDSEEFFEERILGECMKEYEFVLNQYRVEEEERQGKREEKRKYIIGQGKGRRPLVLPRIMIMPTTRCNLRCQGCSSLLPCFEKPEDIAIGQIIDDFEILFSGVDECIRVTVGGEPFLYPHLKDILEYLITQPKVLGIMLVTNSTILPRDEVIELIKNPKVFIEVSDYGHLERMSRLVCLLEENNVNFIVLTGQTWTDMGDVECRCRSNEELRFNYLNCEQGRIIKGIHNGKFHTCARSARMLSLGAYSSEHDYFDLRVDEKGEAVRKKIEEMYYSESADACNHCDLGALPTKVIEAGVQMKGTVKKSAYTIVNREEYERLKRLEQVRG